MLKAKLDDLQSQIGTADNTVIVLSDYIRSQQFNGSDLQRNQFVDELAAIQRGLRAARQMTVTLLGNTTGL